MTEEEQKQEAETLVDQEFRNIGKRIKEGKRVSAAERAFLLGRINRDKVTAADPWAANGNELAEALGVSRSTIANWVKLEGAPVRDRAMGYDIPAWRAFVEERGLKSLDVENPVTREELEGKKAEREWRQEKLRIIQRKNMPLELFKRITARAYHQHKEALLAKAEVIALRIAAIYPVPVEPVAEMVREQLEETLVLMTKFEYKE